MTRTRQVGAASPVLALAGLKSGLSALRKADRALIDHDVRQTFAESLDLDSALRARHPQDRRWDYLLGHAPSTSMVGLEPHSAKQDEISAVIAKRRAALAYLRDHLRPGKRVVSWFWVASGRVFFADTEKARRRLDQAGIKFVGTRLLEKHLPPRA